MKWLPLLPLEIKVLIDYKDSKDRFQLAVDMFLLGCVTAMRIDDIITLKPSCLVKDHIQITTRKTKKSVRIPISNIARDIIDKYQGNPLRVFSKISQQKARTNLKVVVKEAGLNRTIVRVRFQLAKHKEEHVPLHKFLGFHHAKRTTVSFLLKNGAVRGTV